MLIRVRSTVEDPELVTRRRSQLVSAAIELFCREGFHCTTVKDIARVAGVSAGLLYQYIRDKQDLLFLCLSHIVATNRQRIPAAVGDVTDPILRLSRAVEAYAQVMDANRDAVLLTYRETKSLTRKYKEALKSMELETNKLISSCIRDCVRLGYMKRINAELLTYHLVILSHGWALKHWRLRSITNLAEYTKFNIHSAWENLLTPKGQHRYRQLLANRSPGRTRAAAR